MVAGEGGWRVSERFRIVGEAVSSARAEFLFIFLLCVLMLVFFRGVEGRGSFSFW